MRHGSEFWLLSMAVLFSVTVVRSLQVDLRNENGVKTAVYLSPKVVLEPGSVSNKNYYNIDFPRGHIAIKNFHAELVDEAGNSVPLHETYMHHWVIMRYYQREGVQDIKYHSNLGVDQSDLIVVRNSGICEQGLLQYFGLGSETRRTDTQIPDPFGIEVGNPLDIPPGYKETWMLNVHAMDTRGAEDKLGCTECRCDLYNVTKDEHGRPLPLGYTGGLTCCYDGTRCRLKEGFHGGERNLFLKYTVKYVEWDNSIVPVKIYIIDVTDTWNGLNKSAGLSSRHHCKVEYNVESSSANVDNYGCIDTRKVSVDFPINGDVIYGVAHQHAAGVGMTLYGEDGRSICSSIPIYGEGEEAGNEAGYVVGMSSCYPRPGSVKISEGEILTLESKYSCDQRHSGVMAFFYLLIADSPPRPNSVFHASLAMHEKVLTPGAIGAALLVMAIIVAVVVAYQRRNHREDGYESIKM